MALLDPDAAPGATALEILPVCGVAALGVLGAADVAAAARAMGVLHACAEDLRWRVRAEVPRAVARIGEACGDALTDSLAVWMDGYFHAAAALLALADPRFLPKLHDRTGVIARLDEAFALAEGAPRAAARYPGRKALVDALALAPPPIAARFGAPVLEAIERWCATKDPDLRNAVLRVLRHPALARFPDPVARVRAALEASATLRRDADRIVHGTRGRGRKKHRR
jgi:hypothetical protein